MKRLEVKHLSVAYDKKQIIFDLNFSLEESQIGCLLGPSGCGKTTALRAIAGFEKPTKGEIIVNGCKMNDSKTFVEPEKRKIGMIFQDIALFPHLSVLENIQFGIRSWANSEMQKRSYELLELVDMFQFKNSYPHQLSGGQQQRIALARAMAPKPSLLLMDEPFSSLDSELREQLAKEVRLILKQEKISAILVTHDQNEAFVMGDHICLINKGRVQQNDSAYNLYHTPLNRFVGEFIGEGSLLPGVIVASNKVKTDIGEITGSLPEFCKLNDNVDVLIRPENIILLENNENQAMVKARYFRGSGFLYILKTNNGSELSCFLPGPASLKIDQSIGIQLQINQPIVFK
tara:strand:- start:3084 stop:4121 length:1038 start_codon:yes stop_codon:yes gene_type:complete